MYFYIVRTADLILSEMTRRGGNTDKVYHAAFVSCRHKTWVICRKFNRRWVGAGREDEFRIADILHVPASDEPFVRAQVLISYSKQHLDYEKKDRVITLLFKYVLSNFFYPILWVASDTVDSGEVFVIAPQHFPF